MASLKVVTQAQIGSTSETAAAADTTSGVGLNGRLQRIAQRITSLIAALPTALGSSGGLKVESLPGTSGGCWVYHVVAAATTNTANIKSTPGQVFGVNVFNKADYPIYVKLHNTSGTPTAGSGVVFTVGVQAGLSGIVPLPLGIEFSTGIGISIVKGILDNDTTVLVAQDCVVDVSYK